VGLTAALENYQQVGLMQSRNLVAAIVQHEVRAEDAFAIGIVGGVGFRTVHLYNDFVGGEFLR